MNRLMQHLKNNTNFADFLKTHQGVPEEKGTKNNTLTALTSKLLNGKRVYLATSLEMSTLSRETFVGHVKQMGADVYDAQAEDPSWKVDLDVSDTVPGTTLSAADFVICDSRSGWEFWLA